jgi:hypothetical protein
MKTPAGQEHLSLCTSTQNARKQSLHPLFTGDLFQGSLRGLAYCRILAGGKI